MFNKKKTANHVKYQGFNPDNAMKTNCFVNMFYRQELTKIMLPMSFIFQPVT